MGKYVKLKERPKAKMSTEHTQFIEDVKTGRKDPVFFAEKILGLKLHDGQKVWLWMTTRQQLPQAFLLGMKLKVFKSKASFIEMHAKNPEMLRNILVPSNRWGKTLVTSVKHLWYNFYKIGVRGEPEHVADRTCGTLNLSPHSNQCDAGYQYILDILCSKFVYSFEGKSYKNVCRIGYFFEREEKQKRKIHFFNNTSYRAVPTGEDQASSLAGTPYLYISYDECAQSMHLKEELPAKIMSRLIDFGGPLDLVSTPEVDRPSHQYFFHIAKMGLEAEEGWFTMIGKIFDNTFLGESEVTQTLASIKATDPAKYRQVAYGEFVTTGKKMFDTLLIERIWDRERPETPLMDHKYLLIADWGFADNGDPTVFYVLDYTLLAAPVTPPNIARIRIVYSDSIRGGSPFAVLAQAKMLQREWNGAEFLHDAAALGGVMIKKMLKEMEIHNLTDYNASSGAGNQSKVDMLFSLLSVLSHNRKTEVDAEGKVKDLNPHFGDLRGYYIPELEDQLGNYAFNPAKGVSDRKLEQDHVMCLGMGISYLMKKFRKQNEMKNISFNPLAPTLDKVFGGDDSRRIQMKEVLIQEKRIF